MDDIEFNNRFSNIERTDNISFPNYREFKKFFSFDFINPNGCFIEIYVDDGFITVKDSTCDYIYFYDLDSEENYIKALDISKRLFLGDTDL